MQNSSSCEWMAAMNYLNLSMCSSVLLGSMLSHISLGREVVKVHLAAVL